MISLYKISRKLGPFWSGFLFSIIVFGVLTSIIVFLPDGNANLDLRIVLIIYGSVLLASIASGFMNRYILGSKKNAGPYFSYKERVTLSKYYRKKIVPTDPHERQRLLPLISRNIVIIKRTAKFFIIFFIIMAVFEVIVLILNFKHEELNFLNLYPFYFVFYYFFQRRTVKRYEAFKSRLESATINNKKYPWSDTVEPIDYKIKS